MGACESTKKHRTPSTPVGENGKDGTEEPLKQNSIQPSKPVNLPKFSEKEKSDQMKLLKASENQNQLASAMQNLTNSLQRLLSKLDLNITCFVMSLPVESKAGRSDVELINEFESKREDLKISFKTEAKQNKSNILNDQTQFFNYKEDFQTSKEKLGPTVKILSRYKENLVFQIVCNHAVVFEEIARKLEDDNSYSFYEELMNSIIRLHVLYFNFFEFDDPESLEKEYFNYVNEEYTLFNLFYREGDNQF